MEKLCRVYKHVLRNSNATAIQLLRPMLSQMTTLYATHPLSPSLNMVRICIKDYANHSDAIGNALATTFQQCVTHTSDRYLNSSNAMVSINNTKSEKGRERALLKGCRLCIFIPPLSFKLVSLTLSCCFRF